MSILLTADIHLTDNPRDEYRWGLFPWMKKQVKQYDIKLIALLGDLTDSKDRHSGALANRVIDNLASLSEDVPVVFDPGNHDGIQEGNPFFRFSNHIKRVKCLTEPYELETGIGFCLFLPNTRDYKKAWAHEDFSNWDYIFCHQTFEGCETENGTTLSGIPHTAFGDTSARIYSGDIHVPQIVSKRPRIEYVGAPYRIRFGDNFTPRCLLLQSDGQKHRQLDLHFPTINKFLIELSSDAAEVRDFQRELKRLGAKAGDQVKLRVSLARADYPAWPALKAALKDAARKAGIGLWGPELKALAPPKAERGEQRPRLGAGRLSPEGALRAFAKKEGLSSGLLEAGKDFLGDR